jgi:hypothetical protein
MFLLCSHGVTRMQNASGRNGKNRQEIVMEFTVRNLSVLAYAQGFTLWHYRAPNAKLATLGKPGFFNKAADLIAQGDMLMMSGADGGRVAFVASAQNSVTLAALA